MQRYLSVKVLINIHGMTPDRFQKCIVTSVLSVSASGIQSPSQRETKFFGR